MQTEIQSCRDPQRLGEFCLHSDPGVVTEATFRLIELGAEGIDVLESVLTGSTTPACVDVIAGSISIWPDEEESRLERIFELAQKTSTRSYLRFLIAKNLLERAGGFDSSQEAHCQLKDLVVDSLIREDDETWFLRRDWEALVGYGVDELELAMAVSISPQPHAYLRAIQVLTSNVSSCPEHVAAVERFLYCGTERAKASRVDAASWLHKHGVFTGMPVLAERLTSEVDCFEDVEDELVAAVIRSACVFNHREIEQGCVENLLSRSSSARGGRDLFSLLAEHSNHGQVIERAVAAHRFDSERSRMVTRLARTFQWGIEQGFELLNQEFKLSTLTDGNFGYTRLNENKVYVSVLPMIRQHQYGRKIVEGLIVHELGHHLYHKGPGAEKIWRRAESENIHGLLNLVADEHLERNLRSRSSGYDERLKRLGAYAFQHTQKEFSVRSLLDCLGDKAFDVLTSRPMDVARDPTSVKVRSGHLLMELERWGSSFSRFFRALRMGTGNRYNDPKVELALGLFGRDFRDSKMSRLYKIAVQLKEIFKDEAQILDSFSFDAWMTDGEDERARHGKQITDREIESEIRRITSPGQLPGRGGHRASGGPRWLNLIDDIEFEPITNVVKLSYDRQAWAGLQRTGGRTGEQIAQVSGRVGCEAYGGPKTSQRVPPGSRCGKTAGDASRSAYHGFATKRGVQRSVYRRGDRL